MELYVNAVVSILTGGWPLAVLVIALLYGKPLRSLLAALLNEVPRVQKAWGLELTPAERQTALTGENAPTEEFKQLPGVARTASVMELERRFATQLATLPQDEHEARLRAALAYATLQASFERAYGSIFGSQIHALEIINAYPRPIGEIEALFTDAAQNHPQIYKDYTFQEWLRFLENFELVEQKGEKVEITNFGREFLAYLAQSGKGSRAF